MYYPLYFFLKIGQIDKILNSWKELRTGVEDRKELRTGAGDRKQLRTGAGTGKS